MKDNNSDDQLEGDNKSSRNMSEVNYPRHSMPSVHSESELQTNVDGSVQDFDNKTETNTVVADDDSHEIIAEAAPSVELINPTIFEVLQVDSNTQRKFLENIDFDDSHHLTEAELKNTVFNAYKTIEKLQGDLM